MRQKRALGIKVLSPKGSDKPKSLGTCHDSRNQSCWQKLYAFEASGNKTIFGEVQTMKFMLVSQIIYDLSYSWPSCKVLPVAPDAGLPELLYGTALHANRGPKALSLSRVAASCTFGKWRTYPPPTCSMPTTSSLKPTWATMRPCAPGRGTASRFGRIAAGAQQRGK